MTQETSVGDVLIHEEDTTAVPKIDRLTSIGTDANQVARLKNCFYLINTQV